MAQSPRRAAQYVRMSTEHQNYSVAYQTACNAAYALREGFEIVRTYADEGISGLTLAKRPDLQQLLADVVGGKADFEVILVYDVSRWGRFQDLDEGAHYEFLCRAAGVAVAYTGEPFANDGSLISGLVKHMKRAMAAEYSRDLSAKLSRAMSGLAAQGFWMGGPAPFGYRRQAIAPDGKLGLVMEAGEHKALLGHRTTLVPGPDEEVAVLRNIFTWFAAGETCRAIAVRLNAGPIAPELARRWTAFRVLQILRNEVYLGTNVHGRREVVLRRVRALPQDQWRRAPDAFPALIDRRLWRAAQKRLAARSGYSQDELIAKLRQLYRRKGRLSHAVMARDRRTPDPFTYIRHFGSLERAFELAGCERTPDQQKRADRIRQTRPHRVRRYGRRYEDAELIDILRRLLATHGKLTADIIDAAPDAPCPRTLIDRFGSTRRAYELAGYTPNLSQQQRLHS